MKMLLMTMLLTGCITTPGVARQGMVCKTKLINVPKGKIGKAVIKTATRFCAKRGLCLKQLEHFPKRNHYNAICGRP